MKQVTASMLTYDADVGRIEPGQTYLIDDERAARWITAGIATEGQPKPPPPPPPPEPEDEGDEEPEPESESDDDADPEQLATQAHTLHDQGSSEREIAKQMGISRTRVHTLLSR